ncbi:neuronal acetylcholine receptor subunit alpha-3-like [Dreissena polymorpha]|uniref:Uncharacterized protein n=1 Tax=Dreissena polymorpha TaxID=45954 RepID=A0A9D4GJX0_DREPO|nr:neuronal acetylcholine receptor subunit alpha-3-like [Dreissena polymorpha]KAH3818776.1 hypothetical protein DPMN_120502 [Dreissena polymorpha]
MPRRNASDILMKNLEMVPINLEGVNQKSQTISLMAYFKITWRDVSLQWDPNDFSGIHEINVKIKDIWRPDIKVEGSFIKPSDFVDERGNAVITYTGEVVIWPYDTYTVACRLNVAKFPFDTQKCQFDLSSWTLNSSLLVLTQSSATISLGEYSENSEWALLRGRATSKISADGWSHHIIQIELKRKPMFFTLNIMIPVIFTSLLNVLSFLLPTESGERVTLGISLFLSLAVFANIINGSLPESSDEVSLFGLYALLQLIGSGVSLVMIVLSLHYFHQKAPDAINRLQSSICVRDTRIAVVAKPHDNALSNNIDSNAITRESDISPNGKTYIVAGGQVDVERSIRTPKMMSHAIDRYTTIGLVIWHVLLTSIVLYKIMD